MKRIDGQIWIDKKAPYRLKYHINGVDYVVQVSSSYEVDDSVEDIWAGQVLKITGKNAVGPAVFPDDVNKVIGVSLNGSHASDQGGHTSISVASDGYLIIDKDNINSVLLPSDLDITKNGWMDESGGVGANVYWFIGRTVNTGGTYTHEDSKAHPGYLTFTTPSGYKYKNPDLTDESMNVYYDNLPIVGTVAGYNLDGNIITELHVNLNFSSFDSSIEWSWPGYHTENCGKITKVDPVKNKLKIHHGLFADNDLNLQTANYIKVIAAENAPVDDSDYTIATHAINKFTGDDRYTEIDIFTPEDLYYRIIGNTHYNFDRNHGV